MNLQELASMSAYIKQELSPLADKLGQTAALTYGIFLKQVWADAISDLLFVPVGIVLIFLGIRWTKWCWGGNKEGWSDTEPLVMVTVLLVVIGAFMIFIPSYNFIRVAINPDYQAIKLIFETIKTVK